MSSRKKQPTNHSDDDSIKKAPAHPLKLDLHSEDCKLRLHYFEFPALKLKKPITVWKILEIVQAVSQNGILLQNVAHEVNLSLGALEKIRSLSKSILQFIDNLSYRDHCCYPSHTKDLSLEKSQKPKDKKRKAQKKILFISSSEDSSPVKSNKFRSKKFRKTKLNNENTSPVPKASTPKLKSRNKSSKSSPARKRWEKGNFITTESPIRTAWNNCMSNKILTPSPSEKISSPSLSFDEISNNPILSNHPKLPILEMIGHEDLISCDVADSFLSEFEIADKSVLNRSNLSLFSNEDLIGMVEESFCDALPV